MNVDTLYNDDDSNNFIPPPPPAPAQQQQELLDGVEVYDVVYWLSLGIVDLFVGVSILVVLWKLLYRTMKKCRII